MDIFIIMNIINNKIIKRKKNFIELDDVIIKILIGGNKKIGSQECVREILNLLIAKIYSKMNNIGILKMHSLFEIRIDQEIQYLDNSKKK